MAISFDCGPTQRFAGYERVRRALAVHRYFRGAVCVDLMQYPCRLKGSGYKPKIAASGGNRCRYMLLAYQGQTLERIMRFVLSLIVAVTVLGAIQASSEEIALGVSLASVDNRVTVGSGRNDCPEGDWNTAAIKEGESESPELTAVIESNREGRERTVVIDR